MVKVTGRPLAGRIYDLIDYIDQNLFKIGAQRRKNDPRANKARVLRETKLLPKLIFRIESYNKFVILLGKKIKNDLSHFLHNGIVRDFRIKKSALLQKLHANIIDNSSSEIDESQLDEAEHESIGSNSDNEEESNIGTDNETGTELAQPLSSSTQTSHSSNSTTVLEQLKDSDTTDMMIAIRNFAKINERTKRKLSKKNDDDDNDEDCDEPGESKQKKRKKDCQRKLI